MIFYLLLYLILNLYSVELRFTVFTLPTGFYLFSLTYMDNFFKVKIYRIHKFSTYLLINFITVTSIRFNTYLIKVIDMRW